MIKFTKRSFALKILFIKDIESDELSTFGTDLLGIAIVGIGIFCLSKTSKTKMEEFNHYSNYLYVYYLDLLAPSLGIFLLILTFFRKRSVRRSAKEEFLNLLS
jgi:hypothetical protein